MKILIILNDLKNGGVERVLSVLANYLAEKDYEVHMLAIASDCVSYPLSERVRYEYVPIMQIYKKVGLLREFQVMGKIYKEIKRIAPDYVIGFDDSIIIRSVPSAWLQGRKILVSERIDPSIYGLPMRIVRQVAYDMAKSVVFQTEDAQKFFPKRTQRKSVVIPNPLTENLPYRLEETNKDIIMACRLRSQKNVHLAIRGFAKFYPGHEDYRLVVYGEGEQLEELQALATELGVADNVVFPGHVSDIHQRMRSCAMYLSTSDYEGISNSMLEALAIGAPSVCTDCPVGGARMFIKDGVNGILTPVGDADAVAAALTKIADDADFAASLSKESVKIRELLSTDVICPQWEALLCR